MGGGQLILLVLTQGVANALPPKGKLSGLPFVFLVFQNHY